LLGSQIFEQASLLNVGACEQIWITTKLPEKAIFRGSLNIVDRTYELITSK